MLEAWGIPTKLFQVCKQSHVCVCCHRLHLVSFGKLVVVVFVSVSIVVVVVNTVAVVAVVIIIVVVTVVVVIVVITIVVVVPKKWQAAINLTDIVE